MCASNLRQIGLAYYSYANDNKGRLPAPAANGNYPYFIHYSDSGPTTAGGLAGQPKFDAGRFLFPYVRSMHRVFLCPSARPTLTPITTGNAGPKRRVIFHRTTW